MADGEQAASMGGETVDGMLGHCDVEHERALHVLRLKQRFLEAFQRTGVCAWAARQAGTSRMAVWRWRQSDPEFAAAYDDAAHMALARLEKEAVRRAMVGTKEPIYYQGQRVGYVRRYSDALLIFLLKARDPDTYQDRRAVDVRAAVRAQMDVTTQDAGEVARAAVSAATIEAIAGLLAQDDEDPEGSGA